VGVSGVFPPAFPLHTGSFGFSFFANMGKYNVGIVGLGWPGERHAEGVLESGLGHLYAACDLNEARRKKFAAKYSPEKVFSSYEEMLGDVKLHAVVVSLPNALHFPGTLKALQAGKHVLCEKPPALNAEQMRQLHAEAEQRG
jgi:predicted dehydrogenase